MANFNYKSFDDMARCIRKNIAKIPFDFDRIVGIPRSGIIPAYMIALFLNKRACSLDELIQGTSLSSGYSREVENADTIKKVLIVDDSIHSGVALSKTKEKIQQAPNLKNIEIKYLAIYAREQAISFVDYYFEIVPVPRFFQWNYLNINVNERSCFDIDGVLCVDPTPEENDDGEKYRNFILNAKPLYIPKYKIKALVTSRLEKYRKETEEWLKKHNVKYEKLYMLDLPNKEARIRMGAHGKFKAKIFAQTTAELFVESEPKQAKEIAELSGKPCICVGNDKYYEGDGICKVDIFDLKEFKRIDSKKRILLFSHEFTYTGAPHSLLRICRVLKDKYYLEVWGPETGEFEEEFRKLGLTVRIIPYSICAIKNVKEAIKTFDFCIVNTLIANVFYDVAHELIPTVWYIREATNIPEICRGNKDREMSLRTASDLYCVSDYARNYIAANFNKNVNVLQNCMEDYAEQATRKKDHKTVNFLQLGTITERKGFVEYVAAFKKLPDNLKNRAHLYFAGRLIPSRSWYWEPLLKSIQDEENITYLGEIQGQEKKVEVFNNIDVFVVASFDESCSLVVLEGAMLSKPLIVTENVGAKYMVSKENGFIVETKNVSALAKAMEYFILNSDKIDNMGEASRRAYEQYASMDIYRKNILALAKQYLKKNKFVWAFKRKVKNAVRSSLPFKFLRSLKNNGVKITAWKVCNYITSKVHLKKKSKDKIPVALWGTSASKIALNESLYAKIDTWVGKLSIRTIKEPAFSGNVYLKNSTKDTQNLLLDIKKNAIDRITKSNAKFIIIDLLDEKFDLIRFNGKYAISKSDLLMRNLNNLVIDDMPFARKQMLKFTCPDEKVKESIKFFAESIKEKYAVNKIILNEVYFALQYWGKDGKIHDFPEKKKKSFEEKNGTLKNLYTTLKQELGACHVISYDKIVADENHPHGLSTMHFTHDYYRKLAKRVDKILKEDL